MKLSNLITGWSTSHHIYRIYGFQPNPGSPPLSTCSKKVSSYNGSHNFNPSPGFKYVQFCDSVRVDICTLRNTVETALMADWKKVQGSWSPQDLYVKSHPNLTDPRNWYNTATKRDTLKIISNNNVIDSYDNNGFRLPDICESKGSNSYKLPRLNSRERFRGAKSAEDKVSKAHFQFQSSALKRGPSFDEATSKLHKDAALIQLSKTTFPPPLGKSVSWPRGSPSSSKERTRQSRLKRSAEKKGEESKITLPPLNPDTGHPFVPHLPLHQPWVSSKHITTRKQPESGRNYVKKVINDAGRDLSFRLEEEQTNLDKVESWFRLMSSDVDDNADPRVVNERFNSCPVNTPYAGYRSKVSNGYRREGSIAVPDLKTTVQYPVQFQELRIERKERLNEKTEIDREAYKLKQKSDLHLKKVDHARNISEDKPRIYATKQVDIGVEDDTIRAESEWRQRKLKKERGKKHINTTTSKVVNSNKTSRVQFLLANVREDENSEVTSEITDGGSDDSGSDDGGSDDGGSNGEVENNNSQNNHEAEAPSITAGTEPRHTEHFNQTLLEQKKSVVNLILANESPPSRKPYHIELSLKRIAEKNLEANPSSNSETTNDLTQTRTTETEHVKVNSSQNGVCSLDSVCAPAQEHTKLTNGSKGSALEMNNETIPDNGKSSFSPEASAQTNKCPSDKSALTKFNILQPFRDGNQPNIIRPQGHAQSSKPACNEWTHPPRYKLDLRDYGNSTKDNQQSREPR